MPNEKKTLPLTGTRVLDLSRVLAGPVCASMLADLGADVTKVEAPGHGDDSRVFTPHIGGESSYFMLVNRGKRSIAIDLKNPEGRGILQALIAESDVIVENFRPGVTARLGIDWESVREINPRIVYVSISGFGQSGPLAHRPAYDHIVQAMGGIMASTGWPDGPPTRVGDAIGDVVAGMYGAWGALAALLQRAQTGEGQHVDVAMLDAMFSLQLVALSQVLAGEPAPARLGNAHPISAPMDSYACADGHIVIAVANDSLFARLAGALGDDDLTRDGRFATDPARLAHQDELRTIIESWTSSRSVDEAVSLLEDAGVPAAAILDVAQVAASDHARSRGLVRSVTHPVAGEIPLVAQPVRFSAADAAATLPAPLLGEHTDEILAGELGLSGEEIVRLRAAGAVS